MSFDNIFRDADGETQELDTKFLGKYSYGRSTVILTDGEEPSGLEIDLEEDDDEWEKLMREAEEQEVKDTFERTALEEKRRERREYQQKYRKGFVPPKKAKTVERSAGRGKKEKRKKLAYYLTPALAESLREAVSHLGVKRREFVQTALESFFVTKPTAKSLPQQKAGFQLTFLYDEIPELLWNKVAALCRDKDGNRVANYYQVAEAALVKALAAV